MASQRPRSPIDPDLESLYEQVFAGFDSNEPRLSSAPSERDIDTIYSQYTGDDERDYSTPHGTYRQTPSYTSSNGRSTSSSHSTLPLPTQYKPSLPRSPSPAANGMNGSSRRQLPPTPGFVHGRSPSQTGSISMPEPEPYDSRNQHWSTDSSSSMDSRYRADGDLLRKATGNRSSLNRRLPEPPRPGLPSDPRPQRQREESYSSSSASDSPFESHYRSDSSTYFSTSTSMEAGPSYTMEAGPSYMSSPTSEYSHKANRNVSVNGAQLSYAAPSHPPPPPQIYSIPPPEPHSPSDQVYGAGPSDIIRRPSDMLRDIANYSHSEAYEHGEDLEYWEEEEEAEDSFVNFALLSNLAVQLKDKVPRGTHVKGSIPYPRAFTGKDIVSTIQALIQRELVLHHNTSTTDRRIAVQVARSLQSQLFFYEVEWGGQSLTDGVEDVYMFLDDTELDGSSSSGAGGIGELPTGVVTRLTQCYVATCVDAAPCYAYSCPRRGQSFLEPAAPPTEVKPVSSVPDWQTTVPQEILDSLSDSEISRQTIIHKIIHKEAQYISDLDIVESDFMRPLRKADPPVIEPISKLEDFIDEVFGNILDLRECNKRLLEVMNVRQREQAYIVQGIGDVFLTAATEFRNAYPIYVGHYPLAEKRLKEEEESNPEFRRLMEQCAKHTTPEGGENLYYNLKHYLSRPLEHLKKYPVFLEAIHTETEKGNPDGDYLQEAIDAIKRLQTAAQLRTFQLSMGRGPPGKWEWHDMVSTEVRTSMSKDEAKRQSIIFELIKGEMAYVKDLENIDSMYVQELRSASPPIISSDRLEAFIWDVYHNFRELFGHHRSLVEKFHEIQREEHPVIKSVTAPMFDAALQFREAYMEYIPNYPIAAYRIDHEMVTNPAFKAFVDKCTRHPDAHRLDMKNFINRPIPRLLRYELLLKGVLDETPPNHEDRKDIPQVLDVIKSLGKDSEPGVVSAKQKVELWKYSSYLVFKHGETVDMDLLNENRSLIHSGKLLRQPESGLEWNGWSELFVLLFDNYLVLTKPKERDGITYYYVNRRPTPLDLLTLVNFNDPPAQRGAGLLRGLRGGGGGERHATDSPNMTPGGASPGESSSSSDSRAVFPCTLHHNGRMGGPFILYAESSQARTEWKAKMEEALVLRKVVQESNKVFEIETLSADTFVIPAVVGSAAPSPPAAWNQEATCTGKVTCSVPFMTGDGRGLVAIGCAEGVWIGFRHDPKSMRRVLHLKLVTQCAMLEEFGLFLVLADKSLFAYHIEALVPSTPSISHAAQVPQKLSGAKDVHFFSIGTLNNRTLVVYMKKKGLESIFRVLEPVGEKINEKVKAPGSFGSRFLKSGKSEWFRIYRDFFLPSESFDLIFLKANIAILCAKGFEIMNLNEFKSVTIPRIPDEGKFASLSKRCDSCRPIGMFRSAEDEFLLCYDEFGLYVDKHGDPSRANSVVEWEGTAERVAKHLPYVLLFDSRFIEVRRLETGRLVQIIPGSDVRCIWDGRGVNLHAPQPVPPPGGMFNDEEMVQDAQVHAVMSAESVNGASRIQKSSAQHVFELLPTVPLYNPGALAGSTNQGYGRQSYSPPRSPTTTMRGSLWS